MVLERVAPQSDVGQIRDLLDPIFDRFASLSARRAIDLGGSGSIGAPSIPDVNRPSLLEPRLRNTETFRACRAIAARLLGAPAWYVFDHAIYKPPRNRAATEWHQDEVYAGLPVPLRTIHFWVPLQDAKIENGCMWYIPGSHHDGLIDHRAVVRPGGAHVLVADPARRAEAVPAFVAAGGVAIHGPRTLHYSGANESDAPRRAWILHFGAYGRLGLLHPRNVIAKVRERVGV